MAIKKRIDGYFEPTPDKKRWDMKIDEPCMRIWIADEGWWPDPDNQILQSEYYLPNVDDPAILYMAMYPHHRLIYDAEMANIVKVKQELCSKQIDIIYNLTHKTIVSPREFCTKRVHFEVR